MWGSKVQVPEYHSLDYGTEQGLAIGNNSKNLAADENLVSQSNLFSNNQTTKMLNTAVPGFSGLSKTASTQMGSMLKGEIPADVQAQIQNSDAARSLGGGFGGGGMGRNLVARDLGLKSLNLIDKGVSSAESWTRSMASIYSPSQMNVQSMFVTPQQQASFDSDQNQSKWSRDYLQAQSDASPDPRVSGLFNMVGGTLGGIVKSGTGSSGGSGGL